MRYFVLFSKQSVLIHLSAEFCRYLGGILTMSETKRKRLEDQEVLPELPGRESHRVATRCGLVLLLSMIIIAWVLFIKYSL